MKNLVLPLLLVFSLAVKAQETTPKWLLINI